MDSIEIPERRSMGHVRRIKEMEELMTAKKLEDAKLEQQQKIEQGIREEQQRIFDDAADQMAENRGLHHIVFSNKMKRDRDKSIRDAREWKAGEAERILEREKQQQQLQQLQLEREKSEKFWIEYEKQEIINEDKKIAREKRDNLIAKNEITWKCFIPYVKELQLIQHDIDLTLDFRRHQNESPNIEWECPPFKHYYDEWMLSPKFIQKEGKKMIPIL